VTVNLLVIRDPDWENVYVTDGEINEITIDIGGNWEGYKYFCASLTEDDDPYHEEALDFERSHLGLVADLPEGNPVREGVEEYFREARRYYQL
jgi:hypothetical protein